MYTILINTDNTATAVERQRIMQYSKLVDTLRFIVAETYNGWQIDKSSFVLQYRTPVTHTLKLATLELSDEPYSAGYLQYKLSVDTDMTAENGDLELLVSFKEVSMNEEGEVTTRNRNVGEIVIPVIPVSNWFTAPDEALDTLTQYYVANQQTIQAISDLIGTINQNKADDVILDAENGRLHAGNDGKKIGEGISLEELGDLLAEWTRKGLIKINT